MEDFLEKLRTLLGGPLMDAAKQVVVVSEGTGIASTPASNAPDPFHPDYGLPDVVRLRAVHIAETKGVKAAASECKVALSTVYRWRNAYASSASSV